jgi:integrase
VRYALSALPPHLRADATTYVLDPDKGYELNHGGTNGFSCFVERREQERADFRNEGFSLRWDQVDLEQKVIRLDNNVKTPGSVEPIPLSDHACEVLKAWRKEQGATSPFLFPSLVQPDRPVSTVKTVWKATLKRARVPHFALYNLRHVFCTRLSGVAPDAVVQRAMRHTSPETKRRYQLGMADQVRKAVEKANKSIYGKKHVLRFYYGQPQTDGGKQDVAPN